MSRRFTAPAAAPAAGAEAPASALAPASITAVSSQVAPDAPVPAEGPAGRPAAAPVWRPTVVETYGHVLTITQVCQVLGMSRATANRLIAADQFPIPALPRRFHQRWRFAAVRVDRYLERAEAGTVVVLPRDGRGARRSA